MYLPIILRPVRAGDEPFLYRLYTGTREDELAPLGWDDARKEQFLQMQFDAQHRFYQEQFPTADFQIIMLGSQAIGRLYVDRRVDEIRVVDIALLREHRNAGVGGAIMRDLLLEAARDRKPVRIHVEQHNPALRLYERQGFARIGDNGVYYLMEWSVGGSSETS